MTDKLDDIYKQICRINGRTYSKNADKEKEVSEGLKQIEKKLNSIDREERKKSKRITEILGVVVSLANLDYNKKAIISDKRDDFDALALGINMLGEELQASTISLHEKEVLLKEIH